MCILFYKYGCCKLRSLFYLDYRGMLHLLFYLCAIFILNTRALRRFGKHNLLLVKLVNTLLHFLLLGGFLYYRVLVQSRGAYSNIFALLIKMIIYRFKLRKSFVLFINLAEKIQGLFSIENWHDFKCKAYLLWTMSSLYETWRRFVKTACNKNHTCFIKHYLIDITCTIKN